jgi:tRNA uridine 5-carboxymethylaminomethyl modification enzyme
MNTTYDIIVVGGGHAGCEAAHAAATMGSRVLLLTMNLETIAKMSCNPAMGGVAKGQIIREIDALGGMSGIITDKSMIQFRMLNKSKGPAMWSPRAQSDRQLFSLYWRDALEQNPNVHFFQDSAVSLSVDQAQQVNKVHTSLGFEFFSRCVILTSGTFLNGLIHIGRKQMGGGRMAESKSVGITECLESFGFQSGRMKTGTPPRVDGRSLNYDKMEEQKGDQEINRFSFTETPIPSHQRSCHITYTNPDVHDILREGFDESPMFNGQIQSIGPRYCPSIEDKINRFAERDRHQIFVEPEGWNTVEVYVNGFSTSLPQEIQVAALQRIPGFEQARIFRPGYAIEYDYFPPTQLKPSLETKLVKGLFFAGQINGTTGYEEAACQGLLAGINAHRFIQEMDPLILKRSEAYIGVLIDDLINKGTDEPYRMFTSRAEYRILLRQDNADQRLTPIGHDIGLASDERMQHTIAKRKSIQSLESDIKKYSVSPEDINDYLQDNGESAIDQKLKLEKLILRPRVSLSQLAEIPAIQHLLKPYTDETIRDTEVKIKYKNYIDREKEMAEKLNRLENVRLHNTTAYHRIQGLSSEAVEKLNDIKPQTIGQASRISGVSPSDVSVLLIHFGR